MLDELLEDFAEPLDRDAFEDVRAGLCRQRDEIAEREDIGGKLVEVGARLQEGRQRALRWRLDEDGFDAVSGGLTKTYARARSHLDHIGDAPRIERLHQWRKRVKYHHYHLSRLRSVWMKPLEALRDETGVLEDKLGEVHDFANLRRPFRTSTAI